MSTVVERHPSATRAVNKRAFLAGGTATAALIAAAALVLVSLAAYVAFNGIPGGDDGAGTGSVQIESIEIPAGAPEAAAGVLARASHTVAATAALPTPVALAPGEAGGGGVTAPTQGATVLGEVDVGVEPGNSGGQATVTAPDLRQGVLGGAVDAIEPSTDPVIDAPLGEAAGPVTGPLDDLVEDALQGVGGSSRSAQLGAR